MVSCVCTLLHSDEREDNGRGVVNGLVVARLLGAFEIHWFKENLRLKICVF